MILGTPGILKKFDKVNLKYKDSSIEHIKEFKYLGVMVDDKLTFKNHVDYVKKKAIPRLRMLHKYKYVLNVHLKLMLYKTLIVPLFDYADIIYDCLSQ